MLCACALPRTPTLAASRTRRTPQLCFTLPQPRVSSQCKLDPQRSRRATGHPSVRRLTPASTSSYLPDPDPSCALTRLPSSCLALAGPPAGSLTPDGALRELLLDQTPSRSYALPDPQLFVAPLPAHAHRSRSDTRTPTRLEHAPRTPACYCWPDTLAFSMLSLAHSRSRTTLAWIPPPPLLPPGYPTVVAHLDVGISHSPPDTSLLTRTLTTLPNFLRTGGGSPHGSVSVEKL